MQLWGGLTLGRLVADYLYRQKFPSSSRRLTVSLQVSLHKMDLRVTGLLLVLLALTEATPHYKVSKSPYPVKSHGESHVSSANK